MTAADVLRRVDELTDGTGGSVDAIMWAAIGSISEIQACRQAEAQHRADPEPNGGRNDA
jgi:hypothetical protein